MKLPLFVVSSQFPLCQFPPHFVNVDKVGVDKIGINPGPAENIITYHLQWVEMERHAYIITCSV